MNKKETTIENLLLPPIDRKSINNNFLKSLFSELEIYATLDGRFLEYVTANKLTTTKYYLNRPEFPIGIYDLWWKAATCEYSLMKSLIEKEAELTVDSHCYISTLARYDFKDGCMTLANISSDSAPNDYDTNKRVSNFMNRLRNYKYIPNTNNTKLKNTFFNRICNWNNENERSSALYAPFIYRNALSAYKFDKRLNTFFTSTNSRSRKKQENLTNCIKAHMELAHNFCTSFSKSNDINKSKSISERLILNYQLESNYHVLFLPKLISIRSKIIKEYASVNLEKLDRLLIKSADLPNIFTRHLFWEIILEWAKNLEVFDPFIANLENLVSFNNITESERIDLWLTIAEELINILTKLVFPIATSRLKTMNPSLDNLTEYISSTNLIFLGNIILDTDDSLCKAYKKHISANEVFNESTIIKQFVSRCNDLDTKLKQWHKKHIDSCNELALKAEHYVQDSSTYNFIEMFYKHLFWDSDTPRKPITVFDLTQKSPYTNEQANRLHQQYVDAYIKKLEKAKKEYHSQVARINIELLSRYERTKQHYENNEPFHQNP